MQPIVSFIIPTFNRVSLLGKTLDSIKSQGYSNWECIVVDDGSQDHTKELMEFYCLRDPRFKYFNRPSLLSKGANSCRNFGFKNCNGIYVNFFDSDDLIHPEKLTVQVKILESNRYDFSISQVKKFKDGFLEEEEDWKGKTISSDPVLDYIRARIGWLTPAVLWRKKFLKKMDYLFDEELQASQEWEFHNRVLNLDPSYHIEDSPLVYVRRHKENITYSANKANRDWNYFLARLKIYKNPQMKLTKEAKDYLRSYLLDNFKELTRTQNLNAFKAFYSFVLPENELGYTVKFFSLCSIFSFRIFNQGNLFLLKIGYKK